MYNFSIIVLKQEEVNGMVKFYAAFSVEDNSKNETVLPSMPNFEALFPNFAQFMPIKGDQ